MGFLRVIWGIRSDRRERIRFYAGFLLQSNGKVGKFSSNIWHLHALRESAILVSLGSSFIGFQLRCPGTGAAGGLTIRGG